MLFHWEINLTKNRIFEVTGESSNMQSVSTLDFVIRLIQSVITKTFKVLPFGGGDFQVQHTSDEIHLMSISKSSGCILSNNVSEPLLKFDWWWVQWNKKKDGSLSKCGMSVGIVSKWGFDRTWVGIIRPSVKNKT